MSSVEEEKQALKRISRSILSCGCTLDLCNPWVALSCVCFMVFKIISLMFSSWEKATSSPSNLRVNEPKNIEVCYNPIFQVSLFQRSSIQESKSLYWKLCLFSLENTQCFQGSGRVGIHSVQTKEREELLKIFKANSIAFTCLFCYVLYVCVWFPLGSACW